MSFASAAARLAASVVQHLADSAIVVNDTATIDAVWREPHERMLDMMDGSVPSATIRLVDFPAAARGDRVQRVGGAAYRVIAVEPDGYRLAVLRLELWS